MFNQNSLPYEINALEPYMSETTLNLHYGKHHKAYIDNVNKLITGTDLENESLENIIIKSNNDDNMTAIFNNAAQVFNHDLFWRVLSPANKKTNPSDELLEVINKDFSSLDNFISEFKKIAMSQFGSGWVWLVKDGDVLKIMKTSNADNPIAHGMKPLFAVDVWEHSYYVDYQNRRAEYLDAVMTNLINWEEVSRLFK